MTVDRGWPRVADFSTHYSGPLASRELVHLGADVVKIEHPRLGDGNRRLGNKIAGATDVHHTLNSGTRSLAFDLKGDAWPELVAAMARWADVVIVGARPTDAAKRGLDFVTIADANPGVVYCAITGYGEAGPWAEWPAHGLQPDAMAGLMPVENVDGDPAVPKGYEAQGTGLAGLWAAIGIQNALLRRSRGEGAQYVSVSVWEAALAWCWRRSQAAVNGLPAPGGFQVLGPRYRMYACADGRPLLVCPIEAKFWAAFVDRVGLPAEWRKRGDWSTGADRGEAHPEEAAAIAARLVTRTAEAWEADLAAAGVPVSAVRDVPMATASDQAAAVGAFATVTIGDEHVRVPLPAVSVSGWNDRPVDLVSAQAERHARRGDGLGPAPLIGEHTEEVLRELGLGHLVHQPIAELP